MPSIKSWLTKLVVRRNRLRPVGLRACALPAVGTACVAGAQACGKSPGGSAGLARRGLQIRTRARRCLLLQRAACFLTIRAANDLILALCGAPFEVGEDDGGGLGPAGRRWRTRGVSLRDEAEKVDSDVWRGAPGSPGAHGAEGRPRDRLPT